LRLNDATFAFDDGRRNAPATARRRRARAVQARPDDDGVSLEAEVSTNAQTGVEMEALTAVSVAALTVYDMCKALEKGMTITDLRLESKTGGKSGDYRRA